MRENKRKLKFKKIKIANMNTLRGGGETDTIVVQSDGCLPSYPDCPIPASDPRNPCTDACIRLQTGIAADTEVQLCGDYGLQP